MKYNADISGGVVSNISDSSAWFATNNYTMFYLQRGNKQYELCNHLGNVLSVVSDKKILLSGNVHQVAYQKSQPDQFYHQYEYDADNRIIKALTSHDGKMWQEDAHYLYYRHGPLARVELGTQQVQGIDYAYTIQGWLKGVNSNTLVDYRDIGKDAYANTSNANAHFARDEYGYSLNYFSGDYTPTNSYTSTDKNFLAEQTTSSGLKGATKDLYNGNISNMVTTIRQFMSAGSPVAQGMSYGYDQLNRLKSTSRYSNLTVSSNQWQSGGSSAGYNETYNYDANGNITSLTRKDDAGVALDDFTYTYENAANGYAKNTNKLTKVSDAVTSSTYEGDIENGQSNDNYTYDAIGNLIHDNQEEIENISWTVYGKIKKIKRLSTSTKPDLEFYYDPAGNRTLKIVKPAGSTSSEWVYTQYVRDAQGNILSTYNLKNTDYKQQNSNIYGSSRIGEFIPDAYAQCGVKIDITQLTTTTQLGQWAHDFIVLQLGQSETYANDWQAYFVNDFESDISNSVATISTSSATQLYYGKFLAEWATMMCQIRWFQALDDNAFTNVIIDNFKSNWLNNITLTSSSWSTFDESMWANVISQRIALTSAIYSDLLSNSYMAYDDGIYHYQTGSRRYELSNHLGNVLTVITDKKVPNCASTTCNDLPILTNHFTQGTEGWTSNNTATLSQSTSDKLNVAAIGSNGGAKISFSVDAGTTYNLQFLLNYSASSGNISIVGTGQNSASIFSTTATNSNGSNSFSFTPGTGVNTVNLKIYNNANTTGFTIDEVLVTASGVPSVEYYSAQVVSAQDYYPFGMLMPNRNYQSPDFSDKYRFGFNGKEHDNETYGNGNEYDYGFRIYNPRLGKFLTIDPLYLDFPWYTPYQFAGNRPVWAIDLDGGEDKIFQKKLKDNWGFKAIMEIASSTTLGKEFDKVLISQNKVNVFYFTFSRKIMINAGGDIGDAQQIDEEGYATTYAGPAAVTAPTIIYSMEEFKALQLGNSRLASIDPVEIEQALKNGKGLVLIGISEAMIEAPKTLNFGANKLANFRASAAESILHEESAHGLNKLNNKNVDEKIEHKAYHGDQTHTSPDLKDLLGKEKYKDTNAGKAAKEIKSNSSKAYKTD